MLDLTEFQKSVHENAKSHGWWDSPPTFPEIIALCHSELSEAMQEYRNGHDVTEIYRNAAGKPEGVPVELADCVLRILDFCGAAEIDLASVMEKKHEFNKKRPYRHGGKKC